MASIQSLTNGLGQRRQIRNILLDQTERLNIDALQKADGLFHIVRRQLGKVLGLRMTRFRRQFSQMIKMGRGQKFLCALIWRHWCRHIVPVEVKR